LLAESIVQGVRGYEVLFFIIFKEVWESTGRWGVQDFKEGLGSAHLTNFLNSIFIVGENLLI
jgi:hypothetical protein